ncbi:MAG: phosphatidylserine decarboxylase [Saprospiraceae bacterium]|jgi:phosphatidylserine decarboxylase
MLKKTLIGLVVVVVISFGYYQVWFLRQPSRNIPNDESIFVSPANGKVAAVTHWDKEKLAWNKDAGVVEVLTNDIGEKGWLIAIEMDITNVHFQRAPASSQLLSEEYTPGQFNNALIQTNPFGFRVENERNTLLFQTPEGIKYKVVQIAGLLARRIEDYVEPGQTVKQGEVIGLIKLGSQVAIILPENMEPMVKAGDKVVDGESILATIKPFSLQ